MVCPTCSTRPLAKDYSLRGDPMRLRRLGKLLVLFLVLTAFAFLAAAQKANIVGMIADQSGPRVPNLNITFTKIYTAPFSLLACKGCGPFFASALTIAGFVAVAAGSAMILSQ